MNQHAQQGEMAGRHRDREAGPRYWLFWGELSPAVLIILLCSFGSAVAGERVGEIVSVLGRVEVLHEGRWHALKPGDPVATGAVVRTGAGSRAAVQLANGTQLKLNAHSQLELKAVTPHAQGFFPTSARAVQNILRVLSGEVWIRNSGEPLEIQTMPATATIRGTELNLGVGPDDLTSLAVLEGLVELSNPQGSVLVAANEQATAKLGEAPRKTVLVNPLDAVQWTLYYPGRVSYRDYPLTSLAPSRLQERAGELQRRVAATPHDVDAVAELGEVSFDLGKREQARSNFEQALRLAPTSSRARTGLGWVYLEGGQSKMALEEFQRVRPSTVRSAVGEALALYQLDRLDEAQQATDAAQRRFPGSALPHTQAALDALVRGEPERALQALDQALARDPNSAVAQGLRSNIYLVQNRKQPALDVAEQAVRANPSSPSAYLALSAAEQADFDLDSALAAARKAVELDPENPQTRIQEARLLFGMGRTREAYTVAKEARELPPKDSLVESTWGFILLARNRVDEAAAAFKEAIALDTTRGEPHLGLGLALFRRNRTEEAVAELRKASLLESQVSLYQSYLGKAFYEVKNDPLADKSLNRAKKLDPRDPTPFFYDAIRLQSINRPVEALEDLQRSIALNDNRAVYRSRLLLDEDLAARSASLARIYDNLGFERSAQLEASKSLSLDPASFSAHRFLADSYANQPRHEIARVSELLQSQLLQPINIRPLPPSAAESQLLILENAGPITAAFNEFNPLFARDGVSLQASAAVGTNETFEDQIVQSGVWRNLSYSLGQFHYETEGFRKNNDLKQNIYSFMIQSQLSPALNIQAEARHRNLEHGDLSFNFDLEVVDPFARRNLRTNTIRLGAHLDVAPHSDVITSFIYQDEEDERHYEFFSDKDDGDGYIAEAQYLFRSPNFDFILGGGHYSATLSGQSINPDASAFVPGGIVQERRKSIKHTNGYLYSYIRYPDRFTWTLGLSLDLLDHESLQNEFGESSDKSLGKFDRVNPKFGLTWAPRDDTSVRLAAFKTLKRSLLTDQTIEPTQVAGFNQFFDEFEATEAIRYGIGLDHKFSSNLRGGVEVSKRDIELPIGFRTATEFADLREMFYKAYLDWTPRRGFALSLGYELEDFEAVDFVSSDLPDTRTRLLPVSLRYFHPSGWFAGVRTTYAEQKSNYKTFVETGSGEVEIAEEQVADAFALVDFAAGYRLPNRSGIVSIEMRNVFDQEFRYHGIGPRTLHPEQESPAFLPERTIVARFVLAF